MHEKLINFIAIRKMDIKLSRVQMSHQSEWLNLKRLTTSNVDEVVEQLELSYISVESRKWCHLENSLALEYLEFPF